MSIIEKMIENVTKACADDFVFLKWEITTKNPNENEGIRAEYKLNNKDKNPVMKSTEIEKNAAIKEMINSLIDPVKNPYNYKFKDVSFDFYNKIWDMCETKKEQDLMITLFGKFMINYGTGSLDEINTWIKYPYGELLLKNYVEYNKTHKQFIVELLNKLDFSQHKIDVNLIELICKKTDSYYINKLPILNKLKETIEVYYPEDIQKLKVFWKKIEINSDKSFSTSDICFYIGFNKKYLFSINADKNFDFHNSKYKAVSTFFNKEKIKQKLGIDRCVFDGINETQEEYRFILFDVKDIEYTKNIVTDFIKEISQINIFSTLEIMKKTLDYVILNNSIRDQNTNIIKNRKKI